MPMLQTKYEEIVKVILNSASSVDLISLVNVGSYARGNYDSLSDLDFILVWKNEKKYPLGEGVFKMQDVNIGLRNVSYNEMSSREWSQIERHSYSFTNINYDLDKQFSTLIKKKCIWYPNERLTLFCDNLFHLSYLVNITDNYKNCWNQRDELKMALKRGQGLFTDYLILEAVRYMINLSLIADNAFLPSNKVALSPWVKNLSPLARNIYNKANEYDHKLFGFDVHDLYSLFKDEVWTIIRKFELEEKLPSDILKYRYEQIRGS